MYAPKYTLFFQIELRCRRIYVWEPPKQSSPFSASFGKDSFGKRKLAERVTRSVKMWFVGRGGTILRRGRWENKVPNTKPKRGLYPSSEISYLDFLRKEWTEKKNGYLSKKRENSKREKKVFNSVRSIQLLHRGHRGVIVCASVSDHPIFSSFCFSKKSLPINTEIPKLCFCKNWKLEMLKL